MKKIFGIILFLIAFAFTADYKPFIFDNVLNNDSVQQAEFDYLLKYKMFGANGITFNGQNIKVPDKSGWFGTADGNFELNEIDHIIGGPILVGGNISFDNGLDGFTTGPVRVSGDIIVKQTGFKDRANVSAGFNCVQGTVDPKFANIVANDSQFFGENYTICPPSVPEIKTTLRTPTFNDDTITYKEAIFQNGGIYTLDIADYCDLADTTKKLCDIYIDKITLNNDARLYVKMPAGGKLTRLFLKNGLILDGTHPQIRVMYGDNVIRNDKYSGNLLIYSTEDFVFEALAQTDSMQGTFITTGKIHIKQQMTLAGQLLANNLFIDANFDGTGFIYVKFDPDTLDIDPELNESATLHENDSTVVIPIKLSDTATIDVYFSYCFELNDKVDSSDFNLVTDFPVCGIDTKTVKIPVGSKVPTDSIKINVKRDDIEETSDSLIIKIKIESGAVLPNGETSGELKIKITDAPVGHVEFDTTKTYEFEENKLGEIDQIKILNGTATTRFYLDSSFTDRYTLDSITGVLTLVGEPLDYEKDSTGVVKITLTDTGDVSVTRNIPISVIDVNEAPTIDDVTTNLLENLIHPFMVEKLVAKDPDTKTTFTQNVFSMLEGDTSLFRVDSDGEIWAKKTFDYETDQKTYTLKVLVQDKTNPALKDSAIVTVNITNSNDGPKFDRNDTTFHVNENELFKDSIKATDQDGDKITYSIVGTVPFEIDSNGVITSTRTFDYEKEKGFTFKVVADDGKAKDTMTVNIIVDDENEPVHTKDTTFVVDEGKTGEIGKVKGEDEDGKPVKFSCDDSVHYSIDTNTGVLRLVDPFDYEVTKSDTVKVFVTDGVFTDTAIVVINVKNVNEPPILQPNDSLTVPENCKNCIVGIITAVDPDSDKVIYEVKEPGFTIDSNGVLKLTEPLDYEKTPEVKITVIAKDSSGAADTATYVIKVTDINEPVHVQDTTCSVKENYTGKVCKITATDEDKTTPKYIITDTTNYSIDSTGVIIIKTPIDYEKKTKDTVTVIVTDGEFSDTAQVIIRVLDEPETVEITKWDDEKPKDTVKTNDPDHRFEWELCEGDTCKGHIETPHIKKDTVIKVCNDKKTVCDSIVVLFNDAPPVVTLTNAKSTDALIDYITIEEIKDDKIYVNKKENPITVTVKDTVHKTQKHFEITVKLDTIPTKDIKIKEYNYLIDETTATSTTIGKNRIELKEVVKVDGVDIILTKVVDKHGDPVDTTQTVIYIKKVNGKDVTVSYKIDNLTGQRLTDYTVSYNIDSCTTVSYVVDENKKIVKNKEGNIAYTITYDYTDDYGNKATASVEIVYDDIPPKVEISDLVRGQSYNTNAIPVKWTVNGIVQDTLNLQRLEKGVNYVIRRYVDKAGNVSADTVMVIMNEAKDIDIELVHPVTMVDQDKVDEYYSEGHKYNDKKPYDVKFVDPKNDTLPDVIGVGFKVDIVLPSVSPTGSLATLDDIVKNGQIPVDDKGNIVGASTKGIPVDQYVEEHCTEEFQKDYQKYGLNIPLYDVKYNLHLWVYTNAVNYVNDFNIEFTLNDEAKTTTAGTVQMVIDWLADKDGTVKAKNKHALGTGAYLTKLYSKSIAKHRCDYKEQRKGDKTVKKDETMKTFGFKRPNKK